MSEVIKEVLIYSNYEITENVKSKFDKGAETTVVIGFFCPRCKKRLTDKEIPHGNHFHCISCFLEMTRLGNQLICEGLEDEEIENA